MLPANAAPDWAAFSRDRDGGRRGKHYSCSMKVSAVCFGQMREFLPPDAEGNRATLELDDTARVLDLVHMVGAPERLIYVLLVNGERGRLEDPLADGDEVTLMPPYSGGSEDVVRCGWALPSELMSEYHDTEWGVPLRDDRGQFEFLVLEGVQAGRSRSTALNRRGTHRDARDGFDPEKIARYDETKVEMLLINAGLIRNRAKMNAAVSNAKAFLEVRDSMGSFSDYIWQFVDGEPVVNGYRSMDELPAETEASRAMSKDLKQRGFKFVGPTICYAHMQATGMVNDHIVSCWRYHELALG